MGDSQEQDLVSQAIAEAVEELGQSEAVRARLTSWFDEACSDPAKLESRDEVLKRIEELLDTIVTEEFNDED